MFTKYDKFLLALVGAVAQVVQTQYGANHVVQVVLAVLTALGVYYVPNKQQA